MWQLIGKEVKRKEDLRVLLAETRYIDDIKPQNVLYMGFLRSSVPHAYLKKVDTSELIHKVELCITGEQIAKHTREMPLISFPEGARKPVYYALAHKKVRFVGEPVVAFVTKNLYETEELADLVSVDYEVLPPVLSLEEALSKDSPKLFENWEDNVAYTRKLKTGRVEEVFENAPILLKRRFELQRQYGAPIEPRGALATFERSSGVLTLYSSTQWPHFVRTLLSEVLNYPEHKIRVVAPDVGGGFGNKQDFYREEVLVSYAAMKLGKPVKWVATRSEDMFSTVHAGEQIHEVEIAAKKDGEILGLRDRFYADLGAFGAMSLGPPTITFVSMSGPYKISNIELELTCYVTNKTPTGAYRGFGQAQASYVLERMVDELSYELKIDPLELREKNVVTEFPYKTPLGRVIDSGDYLGMIQIAKKLVRSLETPNSAIGVAFGFESGGIGPSSIQDSVGARHRGYDSMTLRVTPDGKIEIYTGLSPHGQGLETTLSQLAAHLFGVSVDDVSVHHGDTQSTPYGFGTWGSRSAVLGAGALLECYEKIRKKLLEVCSKTFDQPLEKLVFENGVVTRKDTKQRVCTLSEVARLAYRSHDEFEAGLEVTVYYEPKGLTVSGGLHIAFVTVDQETLEPKILKYVMIDDCGFMLNPMIVEGQLHGGLAQGFGSALLEEFVYSKDGQPLSLGFMNYSLPTSIDTPSFTLVHHDSPTPLNPLGVKGMGESGIVGPSAAIANAIFRALQGKAKLTKMPFKPWELRKL
ncbi:hypothetical protein B9Q02_08560 [Candidatus Marsarchaeota G1 archaeon BE_D]|uniref:Aldehyde oxidase/xanthine dehydrogenase a/b hammerhead domain-containing protein n=1 Tax=Candidatus Marsarchaeota G1 archaeon BE_D TaxID=1978156 RepID=A0A2R6AEN2_9ARCH|nr:MAG: hypothetical protein B9Q02_08560 [Candidatus Marsarchaeota G1 archaeon BE_D]